MKRLFTCLALFVPLSLVSACGHEVVRRDPAAPNLATNEVETDLDAKDVHVGSAVSFHRQSCQNRDAGFDFNTRQARCRSIQTATGVVTRVDDDSSTVRITEGLAPAPGTLVMKD